MQDSFLLISDLECLESLEVPLFKEAKLMISSRDLTSTIMPKIRSQFFFAIEEQTSTLAMKVPTTNVSTSQSERPPSELQLFMNIILLLITR